MKKETEIYEDVIDLCGARKDCTIWRQAVGAIKTNKSFIKWGTKGMADISGIFQGGLRLEIELKRENGRRSIEQVRWANMIRSRGGLYLLARSVEEVESFLDEASKGINK